MSFGAAAVVATACAPAASRGPMPAQPSHEAIVATCGVLPTPTTIAVANATPEELHVLFDLPDSPALFAPAPDDDAAATYRAQVSARLGHPPDARALVARENGFMHRIGAADDAANGELLLAGTVGVFANPNCIERMLFSRSAAVASMVERPAEYGAFVVRGKGRVKLYVSTFGRTRVQMRPEIGDLLEADVKSGMVLIAHAHNHPFMFDRSVGDRSFTKPETVDDFGASTAPSVGDVYVYRSFRDELQLREAWVSNGLDGVHYEQRDFDVLKGQR